VQYRWFRNTIGNVGAAQYTTRLMSRNTRTSLDNNSKQLMPATINDVPRKLEALKKRKKILRIPTDSTGTGLCKGNIVLVEKWKGEWYLGTVRSLQLVHVRCCGAI
jgi:hypothetical protein